MRRIVLSALTGLFLIVIAVALAYSLRRALGLDLGNTIAIGIGVLFALTFVEGGFRRAREEALLNRRLQDLGFLEGRAATNVQALSARLASVEATLAERSGGVAEPI